jgi:hypothetical protein
MPLFEMPAKDATELLDYQIDMSKELAGRLPNGANDTLTSVVWSTAIWGSAAISDLVVEPFSTMTSSTATVWLSGGTLGNVYEVSAVMQTAGGRTYHRSFNLPVQTR